MVRFYIPFIVGMALFLYFKRMHDEALFARAASERQKIFKEFIHDIKSPLAVLRTFLINQKGSSENQVVLSTALDRIEGMVSQSSSHDKKDIKQKIPVSKILLEVIAQKRIEYPELKIHFQEGEEIYTFADKTKLQRIFSNLINNAYESYDEIQKILFINLVLGNEEFYLRFTDNGKGIPKSILNKIFTENVSTKNGGMGVGLLSAFDYITSIGGSLKIITKEKNGTTIELKFISVLGNLIETDVSQSSIDINNSQRLELDYLLIDDDKYIRLAWEFHAKNSKKSILTFPNVELFLEKSKVINNDCFIYLDLNLNGEKSTKYIDQIYALGFRNIILATGEDLDEFVIPKNILSVSGKLPPV
jgi:hypothetical protein